MNIIKKQDGHVCARACVDGSKEQFEPGYKKEDSASLTVATDIILISATINAHEGRNVRYPRCIPECIQQQGHNYATKMKPGQTDGPS